MELTEIRHDVEDAFRIIRELPPWLQRVALLRGLGCSFAQIAEVTRDSVTRVHHLSARADGAIGEALTKRYGRRDDLPARAARLWALENDPTAWLVEKIGSLPKTSREVAGRSLQRRQLQRAAIALDDYRRLTGAEGFEAMAAASPANSSLKTPHAKAVREMDELLALRNPELSRDR